MPPNCLIYLYIPINTFVRLCNSFIMFLIKAVSPINAASSGENYRTCVYMLVNVL